MHPRRQFLALVSAGGILATGAAAWLMSRWRVEPELNDESVLVLRAVIDALVPRDEFPGALDLGIDEDVLELLRRDNRRRRLYRRGIEGLSVEARQRYHKPFHELPEAKSIDLMEEKSRGYDSTAAFLAWARSDVFRAYYTSPEAFAMLNYRPPKYGYLHDSAPPPRL